MSIKDLDQKEDVKLALETFARNPQGFLMLSGTNGTGKTYAAMEVYKRVTPFVLPSYDHDIAIFITQAELNLWWIKTTKDDVDATHLLKSLTKCKLLVLDDLGTRTPSDAFMDFLYLIADKRWNARKVQGTIITTNLNSADLRAKFTDAFFSRVASGKNFRIEGKDRRFKPVEF